jgi:KaiC/GvpD/RAD55 family RecA-like ATPase
MLERGIPKPEPETPEVAEPEVSAELVDETTKPLPPSPVLPLMGADLPEVAPDFIWDTSEEETKFLIACIECFYSLPRKTETLMRLLGSGVDESWFVDRSRRYIFLGIFKASMLVGEPNTSVRVTAIIEEAEKISGDVGWARDEIQKINSHIGYIKIDEIIETDIPLWWNKLKKPKLMDRLGKADRILTLFPPTIESVHKITNLLEESREIWLSEPDILPAQPKLFSDVRDEVLTALPPDIKLSSGIGVIDMALGGGFGGRNAPDAGKLIVVAARPGAGKTQLAINLAARVAGSGHKVAFWSFEMQDKQLALRAIAAHDFFICRRDTSAAITYDQLNRRRLSEEQRERLAGTTYQKLDENLDVFQGGSLTAETICHQIRIYAKKNPETRLIVIDHLGLLNMPGNNRSVAVGEATRLIKVTATTLGVDVVLLCQLNRAVEGKEDKRPSLPDLRDSGRIEEDADVVLGIYRPYYYTKNPADINDFYILTLKNRQGHGGSEYVGKIYLDNCAICDTSTIAPFCSQDLGDL